uniref:Uncharacterized protein n=1 Tax=Rhodnius prolixus TaxID=13249 RepID=A0A905QWP7_RHOPR
MVAATATIWLQILKPKFVREKLIWRYPATILPAFSSRFMDLLAFGVTIFKRSNYWKRAKFSVFSFYRTIHFEKFNF